MTNKNNDFLKELDYVPRNRVIYARLKAPFAWGAEALVTAAAFLATLVFISAAIGGGLAALLTLFVYFGGAATKAELLPFFLSWTAMGTLGVGAVLFLFRLLGIVQR